MSEDLKACPFCGISDAVVLENTDSDNEEDWYYFTLCQRCHASGSPFRKEEHAREHWNRRAQPAEEVQKLRQALKEIYLGRYCGPRVFSMSDTQMANIAAKALEKDTP